MREPISSAVITWPSRFFSMSDGICMEITNDHGAQIAMLPQRFRMLTVAAVHTPWAEALSKRRGVSVRVYLDKCSPQPAPAQGWAMIGHWPSIRRTSERGEGYV